jgi:hypothetical protein
MNMQITERDPIHAQMTSASADIMRGYIMNVAQNLNDEKLLRMLYLRAINLEAKDK